MATSTTQNAEESPLHRLPPELRNAIWKILYSNKDVEVNTLYNRSAFKARPALVYRIVNRYRDHAQSLEEVDGPAPISKQFWAETTSIFFSSAIFEFNAAESFRVFSMTHQRQAFIPRITHLRVDSKRPSRRAFDYKSHGFWSTWAAALNPITLGQFNSLEGFEWSVTCFAGPQKMQSQNLSLADEIWDKSKLMSIVRALQQRRLRPKLTVIQFRNFLRDDRKPRESGDMALRDEIRELLLKKGPQIKSV